MMEKFHKIWRLILIVGVLNVVVGLGICFSWFPKATIETTIGVMILLSAIISGAYVGSLGKGYRRTPGILMTVLRIATAMVIFFDPLDRNVTFTTLLGIFFGLDGALMIGEASEWKSRKSIYYPALASGITSCIFCALIYSALKGAPYLTIAFLVSATFWIRGGLLVHFAILARNYVSPMAAQAGGAAQGLRPGVSEAGSA